MIRKMFFATAAFTLAQTAAFAGEKVVEFDRDRLNDAAYVEALYAELEDAAKAVCRDALSGAGIDLGAYSSCVEDTLADSVKQVASPMMTAYAGDEAAPAQLASAE